MVLNVLLNNVIRRKKTAYFPVNNVTLMNTNKQQDFYPSKDG